MKFGIESNDPYMMSLIEAALEAAKPETLDDVERAIRGDAVLAATARFVYRGGSHVALHHQDGLPRFAMVFEADRVYVR